MTSDEQTSIVQTLQATINDQKRAIDALTDALAAREHSTAALYGSVDEYRESIGRLQAALAERDATIEQLHTTQQPISELPVTSLNGADGDTAYKIALALT